MEQPRDPIGFELFKNTLLSIADEMALTILRTAYSGVLKDNMDYSTAFCDGERADGRAGADAARAPLLVPRRARGDHRPLRRPHAARRRLLPERPVRGRHAHPGRVRPQADLPRGRAPGLRGDHLPPDRHGRARRRLERVGLDGDLPGRAAHPAGEDVRRRASRTRRCSDCSRRTSACRPACSATSAPSSPPATSRRPPSSVWSPATAPSRSRRTWTRSSTTPSA